MKILLKRTEKHSAKWSILY